VDLKICILFCSRAPLFHSAPIEGADIARASWAMPFAGAVIGLLGALVYWLAHALRLPPLLAAALALAAMLASTGALHEDGLADTADGFGGGKTATHKLEIMRDSRIGTYGACALVLSLLLRAGALASLAEPALVAPALIAAHMAARATLPACMRFVPQARSDGLSAAAGRPPSTSVMTAALLGIIALAIGFGLPSGIAVAVLVLLATLFMAWLCRRQIGGQTGDVLGAVEQLNEILVLLAAARG
jgi:adenosylcobinamide-GDP ribazoletransferase